MKTPLAAGLFLFFVPWEEEESASEDTSSEAAVTGGVRRGETERHSGGKGEVREITRTPGT